MKKINKAIKSILVQFDNPIKAFFFSLIIYMLLSFLEKKPWSVSDFPYFNYMADAFIHNQFHFRLMPPTLHDLSIVGDKIYAYWMPFPDFLFIPFISIFGINFSDIFLTIIIGAINVFLVCSLIKELTKLRIIGLSDIQRSVIVVFFAFGTAHLTLAPLGRIWFTALLIGVMAVSFTYLAAVKFKGNFAFLMCGLGISAALATRNHLIFAGIWPAYFLLKKYWYISKRDLIFKITIGVLPIIFTVLFIAFYNYSRFGNIFDTGLTYHNMNPVFRPDFEKFGLFNLTYMQRNLFYQFINYPFFAKNSFDFFMGGSLFLLSPVFFSIFFTFVFDKKNIDNFLWLLSILLINIPILTFMATGFVQFGSRFSLDFIVPLLLLTSKGVVFIKNKILLLLLFISIFHFVVGLVLLARFG